MAKKLPRRGHPALDISAHEVERMLLSGAYGHFSLELVFKGGVPPMKLQMDEMSYVRLVRSITAVRTLVNNVGKAETRNAPLQNE